MSWAALTSGGKDSILSVQKAIDSGKDVRYLVTARPENRDSYMFHSANLDAVAAITKVAGMEYVEIPTQGRKEEELVDLEAGLAALDIEGVIAGAVASQYQADRVARLRGLSLDQVNALIAQYTTGRFLGFIGEPRVNVLELNLALDGLK